MNGFVIVCAAYCVLSCNCYQFPIVTDPQYQIPILNYLGINESVVFVRNNNTDDILLKSLVTSLYSDHTVVIVRGGGVFRLRKSLLFRNPNTIIITERIIQPKELKSEVYKVMFRSNWSPVHIVVTVQNGSETCENGKFNETYLRNIDACLSYIWHRYKIIIMVVSFPYTCPFHYIIYGEPRKSNKSLYDRPFKIIEAKSKNEINTEILKSSHYRKLTAGYPVRVNIFNRFPTSITACDKIESYKRVNLSYSNGFCGMDGLVMNDFISYYRFDLSVPKDDSCDGYGFVDPMTNRLSGSLACILNKKFDISFNSRFMVMYTWEQYFYLHYISMDTLSVVKKIPGVIPLWQHAFNGFTPKNAIILGALIIVLGILTWAYAWIVADIDKKEPRKLYIYIYNAITSTLFGFSTNPSNRFRVLRGTSLISSIILLAFYQGHVNNLFTTVTRYKELKTLNQLYNSENLLYSSPSFHNILITIANVDDKIQAKYFKTMMRKDVTIEPDYVLDNEKAVVAARGQDAQIQILMNFTDSYGSPLMYVLEEPFHAYFLSYICSTGFLFKEETLRFMMRLLEAGLPNKYYVWTRRTLRLGETSTKTGSEPRPVHKISLQHVRVAFILLIAGYLLAGLSFLVEVRLGKTKQKKYVVESAQSRASQQNM